MSDATPLDPAPLTAAAPDDPSAPIAALAQQKDPGLPPETATLLSRQAVEHLGNGVDDAPDLARRLMAAHPQVGATAANVVARAAVELVARGG